MKITIRGKNAVVTDALKSYLGKKLTKLTRYFDSIQEAQVTVSTVGDNYSVEVTIPLNGGMILRGEDMSRESFYEAVDAVSEKLERQVRKYRTKLYRKFRNQGLKALIAEMGESSKKEEDATIVKTKRFAIKPMSVEEEAMQMELLGHDFYVFANAESEEVNVIYRRRDGNYGLIEPEF